MRDLPASVRALIGSQEGIPLTSAPGYLQARLFSTILPILLLVYAISLGSRAIGGAEEDGTLQLVVTAPSLGATSHPSASQHPSALLGSPRRSATALVLGAIVGVLDDISIQCLRHSLS